MSDHGYSIKDFPCPECESHSLLMEREWYQMNQEEIEDKIYEDGGYEPQSGEVFEGDWEHVQDNVRCSRCHYQEDDIEPEKILKKLLRRQMLPTKRVRTSTQRILSKYKEWKNDT